MKDYLRRFICWRTFKCIVFIFLVFSFLSYSYANEDEKSMLLMDDIYIQTYKYLEVLSDNSAEQRAIKSLSRILNINKRDIVGLLNGEISNKEDKTSSVILEYCKGQESITSKGLIYCQLQLRNIYKKQLEKEVFSLRMEKYAQAHQAFVNGTLKDTNNKKFDIVVDLNILDILLFGDKFSAPQNQSPFFPHFTITQVLDKLEGNNDSYINAQNSNDSNENDDNSSQNDGVDGDSRENENQNTHSFCIDPEALFFKNTHNNYQNLYSSELRNNTFSPSFEDMRNGEYFSEEEIKKGGEYPNLDSIIKREKENGERNPCDPKKEKPLFGGRLCVPSFCTDVFCVNITVKEGYKPTSLRPLDCVECHIDRGNEALFPLVSTLGQNTPNTNPMEPNFLSAFSTFGGKITIPLQVYLQPKKLPFLIYEKGESLAEQKKLEDKRKKDILSGKTDEEIKKEKFKKKQKEKDDRLERMIDKNRKLYMSLVFDCSNESETIRGDRNIQAYTRWCNRYKEEKLEKVEQNEKEDYFKNKDKSTAYKMVVEPFFYSFSSQMEEINAELKKIDLANIEKSKIHCSNTKK